MPDSKKLFDLLTSAGFNPCKVQPPSAALAARTIPGFRIQSSQIERRSVHVFHVGKGERNALAKYERVLIEAGYKVTRHREGLKVMSSRTPADRRALTTGGS